MKKKTRANGTGTAYKVGKTYQAEVVVGYREDGRPIRRTKGGFSTKKAALEYIPTLQGMPANDQRVTLAVLWRSFWRQHESTLNPQKQTHYKTARKRIEAIAHVDVRYLTIDDLQDLVDKETPTYYPRKDVKTLLSKLYDRAVAQGVVTTNLAKYITMPPLNETETTPFSQEEILRLWDAWNSGDIFCGCCLLMIYTGMMPGELDRLTVDMIDLDKQIITGCGIKTKVRKEKPIIMPNIIVPVAAQLCRYAKNGRLRPCGREQLPGMFHDMITRLQLRPELRPYSCRHTTATTLANSEVSLLDISQIMRHSRATTFVFPNSKSRKIPKKIVLLPSLLPMLLPTNANKKSRSDPALFVFPITEWRPLPGGSLRVPPGWWLPASLFQDVHERHHGCNRRGCSGP